LAIGLQVTASCMSSSGFYASDFQLSIDLYFM
jgi:hypothetical protein